MLQPQWKRLRAHGAICIFHLVSTGLAGEKAVLREKGRTSSLSRHTFVRAALYMFDYASFPASEKNYDHALHCPAHKPTRRSCSTCAENERSNACSQVFFFARTVIIQRTHS